MGIGRSKSRENQIHEGFSSQISETDSEKIYNSRYKYSRRSKF